MHNSHVWTWDEYEALPEADIETGACPHCPGLHFGAVNVTQRALPSVYRCHGTASYSLDEPWVPPCGGLFRGRPGEHFDAEWYAVESVGVFLRELAP